MIFEEYGKENQDVVLLLHGGGLAPWNFADAARALQNDFRVVLPVLDGHAGSDRNFRSIEDNAEEILRFIDETCGGKVLLLGGLSLGAQIVTEILSRRKDACAFAIVESACVIPMKATAALLKPALALSYPLVKMKWFARLQFRALNIKPSLFERYFADSKAVSRENMLAFLRANCLYQAKESLRECRSTVIVAVGSRERSVMKKSAKTLCDLLPRSRLLFLSGFSHGEWSVNYGKDYAAALRELVAERLR